MGVLSGRLLLQSPGQLPIQNKRADLTPGPIERNSNPFLQEVGRAALHCSWSPLLTALVDNRMSSTRGALPPARWKRGTIGFTELCMSDPQEYKPLIDTSAQCTLMPSSYEEPESITVSGMTGDPNS